MGNEIVLRASEVAKTYRNGSVEVPALKNCDLEIAKGEFVAIIGKSGSGKSTLLHVLAGLDKPDHGEIVIAGKCMMNLAEKERAVFRRRNIGYIYQDYQLFPEFTGFENIALPLRLDGKNPDTFRIMDLMEQLEIENCRDKFPQEMSGGEQQRISIARAMIVDPAIIFADEPSGNLDAENARIVAEILALASVKEKQTIVMVTHDRQMADYADRILQISDGVVGGNQI